MRNDWSLRPNPDWEYDAKQAAKTVRSKTRWEVKSWKNHSKDGKSYVSYVYVVLLHFPRYEDKFGLYVGRSHLLPQKRLKNHKKGILANSDVQNYGLRLMPALYQHLNPMRHGEAPIVERELYHALKDADLGWVSMGRIRKS